MDWIPSWVCRGAKVVCVGSGWTSTVRPSDQNPVVGLVYTVTAVDRHAGQIYLELLELSPNDAFNLVGFRPVADDNIEAELFRHRTILEVV